MTAAKPEFPLSFRSWALAMLLLCATILITGPATAEDLSVGAKIEARMDVEFLGEIVEIRTGTNGGFQATVQMRGSFANGLPFQGTGQVQIGTDEAVVVGDPVRGRLRGPARGRVTGRTATGVGFELDGEISRVRWLTPLAYGASSKGGGTNWFRIDGEAQVSELSGLSAGATVQGFAEGRFLGEIVGPGSAADTYLAAVTLEGGFLSGAPFEGTVTIEIESNDPLQTGDAIRGRLQAQVDGTVAEAGDVGVSIDVDLLPLNTEWETLNYGGASKGGGTNWFRLQGGLIFGFGGASKGGGTNV